MTNPYARQNKSRKVEVKPKQPSEDQIQMAVVQYLELQKYKDRPLSYYAVHVPNGGRMTARMGNKLKKMGVQAGYCDMLIDIPRGKFHGLRLELKVEKGGIVSAAQKERITVLLEEGYQAVVCRGYDKTVEAIEEYMALGAFKQQ